MGSYMENPEFLANLRSRARAFSPARKPNPGTFPPVGLSNRIAIQANFFCTKIFPATFSSPEIFILSTLQPLHFKRSRGEGGIPHNSKPKFRQPGSLEPEAGSRKPEAGSRKPDFPKGTIKCQK